jgi:hypothetical protein
MKTHKNQQKQQDAGRGRKVGSPTDLIHAMSEEDATARKEESKDEDSEDDGDDDDDELEALAEEEARRQEIIDNNITTETRRGYHHNQRRFIEFLYLKYQSKKNKKPSRSTTCWTRVWWRSSML